jgi:cell division initiation protein
MFNSDATFTDGRRLPAELTLAVMPLDVRQAKFDTTMRGYDREAVTTFLEQAAECFEQALRENDRLRQEVVRLEGSLSQYHQLEGSLKNTLMSAQKLADDMKENATQESARIVREAEGRSELIVQKALARLEDVQREIDGLRMKRRETETHIEAMISALNHTLTFVREQDQRERNEKVVPHRSMASTTTSVSAVAPAPVAMESTPLIVQSA